MSRQRSGYGVTSFLHDASEVSAEVVSNRTVHGPHDRGHYVVFKVGDAISDIGATWFIGDPQLAIRMGQALQEAGRKARQANDVEDATQAALDAAGPAKGGAL